MVRVITPGTLTEDALLDARSHNYLAALAEAQGELALAWLDLSTADFAAQPLQPGQLAAALARLAPGELLVPDRLLHREQEVRPRSRATFQIVESVKVISGPLSYFSGEISEVNEDAQRLKVLVSIFGRETPVEVGFDQVKKV